MAKRESSAGSAAPLIPRDPTLPKLREAAAGGRACDLWTLRTQTVFGEGPARAGVMLVGEQAGHDEDLSGRPLVGPAGKLLDRAHGPPFAQARRTPSLEAGLVYRWLASWTAGCRGRQGSIVSIRI